MLTRLIKLLVIGSLLGVIGATLIDSLPALVASRVFEWWRIAQIATTSLLLVLAFYVVNAFFGYRMRYFLSAKHPPAPIAGIAGGVTFAALSTSDASIAVEVFSIAAISYAISLLLVRKRASKADDEPVFNETPVQKLEDDLFNHLPIAKGLANRIRTGSGPILLIGRFGSGKTSLCNLVYVLLSTGEKGKIERCKWVKVRISGWGIDSPEARAREILGAICEHISDEVDTLSLREQCRGFVQSVFGDVHWLSKLLFSMQSSSTESISQQLDILLSSSNKKVLVILDDFERNAKDGNGIYNWDSGVSEVVEHLKHSKRLKIIACVNRESLL